MVDNIGFKGSPVMTLEATDPSVRGKKAVLRATLFSTVFLAFLLYYMAFFISRDQPFFRDIYLVLLAVVVTSGLLLYLFIQSLLARNWKRILIYESGMEFPNFLWDRMRGRKAFLPKDQIVSISAVFINGPNLVGPNTGNLVFRTGAGLTYRTGDRIQSDILSTSDWLESNWLIRVDRMDPRGNPMAAHRDVPDPGSDRTWTCLRCGQSYAGALEACPSCNRKGSSGPDLMVPLVPERVEERSAAPVQAQPFPPYQYQPPPEQMQRAPAFQYSYGPAVIPSQPGQFAPIYQGPIPGQHPYLYQPRYDLYGKNPRTATILAAVFGLLGMMGIGHLYMRKYVKGVVLLFVGAFLALISLVSIIMLFTPHEYPVWAYLVTAVFFSAPFLLLYAWQMLDAARPKR